MKLRKRKTAIIVLVIMFACIFQLHAVFEGRDEKLQDYTSVRSNVDIELYNAEQKAGVNLPGTGTLTPENSTSQAPISDSPLFFLLLGGIVCCEYLFARNRRFNRA